jgi:hypothetical protein
MSERRAIARADERGKRYGNWPRRAPFDPKAHQRELTELDIYLDHDGEMYKLKKPYIDAVEKRLKAGTYDDARAPAMWLPWVTEGAKRFGKEFRTDWARMFPLPLREHLARAVARHEVGRIRRGEYH